MEFSKEQMIGFYREMVRIRKLDEKLIECLMEGRLLTFYHSCQGQEAPGVALCALLRKDDYLFYQHRGHGINKCLPKGMSPREIIAEHCGKTTGGARGFAGFHYSDIRIGLPVWEGWSEGN